MVERVGLCHKEHGLEYISGVSGHKLIQLGKKYLERSSGFRKELRLNKTD